MNVPWQDQLDEVLDRANTLRISGDPTGAARVLDSAPDIVKAFGTWMYARGSLAFQAGDLARAAKELEAAVVREPAVPEFRANLGAVLLEKGKQGDHFALRRARQLLEEACKDEPKLPHSHTNLGAARLAANELEGALACFDRALALDPNHVPSLYNRGAALKKLGKLEESLAAIDKLLKLEPAFAPGLAARASLQEQLKAQ